MFKKLCRNCVCCLKCEFIIVKIVLHIYVFTYFILLDKKLVLSIVCFLILYVIELFIRDNIVYSCK